MDSPLISIVIPTYNRQGYLAILLDLLRREEKSLRTGFELIVSDNASTDGTASLVSGNPWIGSLKINYICNDVNLGFAKNLSAGIREAVGKYIWILCDDDLFDLGVPLKLLSFLSVHGDVGAVLLNRDVYDITMLHKLRADCLNRRGCEIVSSDWLISHLGGELLTASCVVVSRNGALLGIKRPEYELYNCESLVIALQALGVAENAAIMGGAHIRYRSGNSASWNSLWPVISCCYVPLVVSLSQAPEDGVGLAKRMVEGRENHLFYDFCYIATIQDTAVARSINREFLREIYRNVPGFTINYSIAFGSPQFLLKFLLFVHSSVRVLKEERRKHGLLRIWLLPRALMTRHRAFRKKKKI